VAGCKHDTPLYKRRYGQALVALPALCVACPRQPSSTWRRESDDRTLSVLSACLTFKSRCSREDTEKLNCVNPSEEKTSPKSLERDDYETMLVRSHEAMKDLIVQSIP
jgi:hypothetical protein